MEVMKKTALAAARVVAFLLLCIAVSAVLGLVVEAINWAGNVSGAWESAQGGVAWFNALPWVPVMDSWLRSTGLNPGWLGYLFSLVVLAAFGVFRSRK